MPFIPPLQRLPSRSAKAGTASRCGDTVVAHKASESVFKASKHRLAVSCMPVRPFRLARGTRLGRSRPRPELIPADGLGVRCHPITALTLLSPEATALSSGSGHRAEAGPPGKESNGTADRKAGINAHRSMSIPAGRGKTAVFVGPICQEPWRLCHSCPAAPPTCRSPTLRLKENGPARRPPPERSIGRMKSGH